LGAASFPKKIGFFFFWGNPGQAAQHRMRLQVDGYKYAEDTFSA